MKYKEAIIQSMNMLAKDENTIFMGYCTKFGLANGTLEGVPLEKILETPLAENLMTGLAIGMSLQGFRPVLFFERHDFMLDAIDAIANHMDKLEEISNKQYIPRVIIRAGVGARKPLDSGITHSQDFTLPFKMILKCPVYDPQNSKDILKCYEQANLAKGPVMVVERKELYGKE